MVQLKEFSDVAFLRLQVRRGKQDRLNVFVAMKKPSPR